MQGQTVAAVLQHNLNCTLFLDFSIDITRIFIYTTYTDRTENWLELSLGEARRSGLLVKRICLVSDEKT